MVDNSLPTIEITTMTMMVIVLKEKREVGGLQIVAGAILMENMKERPARKLSLLIGPAIHYRKGLN